MNAQFPAAMPLPPTANLLLGTLAGEVYRRLQPHLEPVELPFGKVIFEPHERVSHVFFPTTGIVSLLTLLKDGASAEIAITGNEGVVGIASFLGGMQGSGMHYRLVVTMAGQAYRLRRDALMNEFERGGELERQLLRYTQALMTQIAQTVVCNRHHRIEEQMCRWLLLRLDRQAGSGLHATQEQIANHLGVRREGVTGAASHLQSCGVIHYSRGHMVILDRPGLEQRVCECYGVITREYARLLGVAVSTRAMRRRIGSGVRACIDTGATLSAAR